MPTLTPKFIYKIVTENHWKIAQAETNLPPLPIDIEDGYMHFSTMPQLAKTLELYFSGQTGVVILAIETATLKDALKWEPSRGGDLFPHLYAQLPLVNIAWVEKIDVPPSGPCPLPGKIV